MKKRVILIVTALIVSIVCLFSFDSLRPVRAADAALEYDKTNALDDLRSSTVNGQAFKITDYPFKSGSSPRLISFVEYCYSYRANMQDNFGLYLYIYNPGGLNFNTSTLSNKVQMATSYNADGTPDDYSKFKLKFLNYSTEANYSRLFYKFKVIDDSGSILARVNSNERRYDISGIELVTQGQNNATEYKDGYTYKFTGYSSGYGSDISAASTLSCAINELKTIELNVEKTSYRYQNGISTARQIDSVYFAVDNDLIAEFGKLQRIKAEWYEYKTAPAIITSRLELYNALLPYLGVNIGKYNKDVGFKLYSPSWDIALWTYNASYPTSDPQLNYAFYNKNKTVTAQEVTDYIYEFSRTHAGQKLPIRDGSLNKDLFLNTVDTGRNRGYNCIEFDSDDSYDLLGAKYGDFFNWYLSIFYNFETADVKVNPIYEVKATDLSGTNNTISTKLLINESDVDSFKAYYEAAKKHKDPVSGESKPQTVFLFRFANTEYSAESVTVDTDTFISLADNKSTYKATQTVFFDFDIIQLTFNKKGLYTVIPVVMSPIDIINGFTPPPVKDGSGCNDVLSIILIALLLIVLMPVLPPIISFLTWLVKVVIQIVCWPFKLLARAFKKG